MDSGWTMQELSAMDVLMLRAIRDGVIERKSPYVSTNVLGVACDRGHLSELQHRGLVRLDHVHAPVLTVDGQMALDLLETQQ